MLLILLSHLPYKLFFVGRIRGKKSEGEGYPEERFEREGAGGVASSAPEGAPSCWLLAPGWQLPSPKISPMAAPGSAACSVCFFFYISGRSGEGYDARGPDAGGKRLLGTAPINRPHAHLPTFFFS